MQHLDLLASLDLIRLVAAALVVGLMVAASRGFLSKLHLIAYFAAATVVVGTHNWPLIYTVMAYGAVSSVLLLSAGRRRAHA